MNLEWNEKVVINMADEIISDALNIIAADMHSNAVKNIKKFRDSGELMNSGSTKVVLGDESYARDTFNAPHAAMREFGGTIKPVNAKSLAIPVHPSAKGKSPRDFSDLTLIPSRGSRPALLVREAGRKVKGGGRARFDLMFVLVKRVMQSASPYLRPALYDNLDKYVKRFASGRKS